MNQLNTYLVFLFLIVQIPIDAQTQIGNDIDGEAINDSSGNSVSLSSDGSIVAIGAPSNDGNGQDSGHVRIYENQSGIWVQIGNDIDGEAAFDGSGRSVSLSADGSIVAIGADQNDGNGSLSGHVRVYENQSGNWVKIGNDIDGEASGDRSGYSVSLSSDGSIVAIGAYNNDGNGTNSGHVRIYENQSGTWVQIGSDINGEALRDECGRSVALSADGSIVAIGATLNNGNGSDSGHVRIFENQSGVWVQIGTDINGEVAFDLSGTSVSLSSDGSIVAIGAERNDGNGEDSGHVRVYENQTGSWVQIGNDIDAEGANDRNGISVSLSSDGSIVAIGAYLNDGNGFNAGHVRVYENQSGTWVQIGTDIDGEVSEDFSGQSISLSSDGSIIAIGGPRNNGNGIISGHVRIYDLNSVLNVSDIPSSSFEIFVNQKNKTISISLNNENIFKQANLYTIDGRYLYSENRLSFSTKPLSSGIYIIQIETTNGITAKKIVLHYNQPVTNAKNL